MSAAAGVNISSIIIGALPTEVEQVRLRLQDIAGVEVHVVAEDGRMIVSIETPEERSTVDTFEAIRQTPGVLSAALVYHQYETDPDEEA